MWAYLNIHTSIANVWRGLLGGIAAVATYIWGGADNWMIGLIVVVAADYISGVIAAIIARTLNSRRGAAGILKKMLLFLIVAVANVVDSATGAGGVVRSLTIGFLMANEGISVLENCARCGIPMPEKLINVLEQLRADNGGRPEKKECSGGVPDARNCESVAKCGDDAEE